MHDAQDRTVHEYPAIGKWSFAGLLGLVALPLAFGVILFILSGNLANLLWTIFFTGAFAGLLGWQAWPTAWRVGLTAEGLDARTVMGRRVAIPWYSIRRVSSTPKLTLAGRLPTVEVVGSRPGHRLVITSLISDFDRLESQIRAHAPPRDGSS